jgi:hypothetical protein
MNRIIFQPDGTPMVPIFSPRRRLYEALYDKMRKKVSFEEIPQLC